jgi:hypothetical protein
LLNPGYFRYALLNSAAAAQPRKIRKSIESLD